MERGRQKASRALPRSLTGAAEPVIGSDAEAELLKILDYGAKDSPRNAKLVADRIIRAIERVGRNPHAAGHKDENAPTTPEGSVAREMTVSGYAIRYLFPFRVDGIPRALIVSIRRGRRKALDDPAYVLRWMEERAQRGP